MLTRCAVLLLLTSFAFAAPPADSIAKAKEELAAGHPEAAIRLLREATPGAASLTDLRARNAALSAIYFYSALAQTNAGDEEQARAELRSFFFYTPGGKLDEARYPKRFTELFTEVHQQHNDNRESTDSFDDAYPGYPPAVSSSVWPVALWGASSEFQILATPEEKDEWARLSDEQGRRAFIERFWLARDPDPTTKLNENRIEFLQRIAFADVAFSEGGDGRGSLTDRGRIFVLLGTPQRLSIRPMNRREAWYAPRRTIDTGNAIEEWTYFRDQLPQKLPNHEVTFRFISEGGSVLRKMQHDFLAEKTLKDAPAALRR